MKPSQTAAHLRRIAQAIDNSKQPDRALVAQALRQIIAEIATQVFAAAEAVTTLPAADPKTRQIEQLLYGRTTPYVEADQDPENPGNWKGSSIWWDAFEKLGMVDWTPLTDFAEVEAATAQLVDEYIAAGSHVDKARLLADLKGNWEAYQKYYMAEHKSILNSGGKFEKQTPTLD